MAFGPHLMINGFGCSKKDLSSMSFIYNFLNECPEKIRMTKITEPYIVRIPKGLAGVVIIAESHISVHTFPEESRAYIDIFSCKDFKEAVALKYIINYFKFKTYQKKFLKRGKKFPR